MSNGRENSNAPTKARTQWLMSKQVFGAPFSRTRLQRFSSKPPCSTYKKLIISTPRLVQALHTMLITKAVPEGIKERECGRSALQEHPPAPYVPEKDPVQESVSPLKMKQSLKSTIGADAELCLPIWHWGTCEAFLMHMSSALDKIKENRAPSRPSRKPMRLMWSNKMPQRKQRPTCIFLQPP